MNHEAYRERLSALLDGELDAEARAETLAHLDGCADCRAYLAADDTSALGMMGAMMNNNPFFKTGTADVSGNNVAPASSNTDNGAPQNDGKEKTDGTSDDSGNGTWV